MYSGLFAALATVGFGLDLFYSGITSARLMLLGINSIVTHVYRRGDEVDFCWLNEDRLETAIPNEFFSNIDTLQLKNGRWEFKSTVDIKGQYNDQQSILLWKMELIESEPIPKGTIKVRQYIPGWDGQEELIVMNGVDPALLLDIYFIKYWSKESDFIRFMIIHSQDNDLLMAEFVNNTRVCGKDCHAIASVEPAGMVDILNLPECNSKDYK